MKGRKKEEKEGESSRNECTKQNAHVKEERKSDTTLAFH